MSEKYKIGAFAKNLGVSTGFLKHHERYGLVTPSTAESGYRYYRLSDGMQVLNCLKLQGMGFTSRETADILGDSTRQDIPELFRTQQAVLARKVTFWQETLAYLQEMEVLSEELVRSGGETYTIGRTEPFYYMENLREGSFIGDDAMCEVAARWNDLMPLVEHCSCVRGASLTEWGVQAEDYAMGLYVRQSHGDRLGIFLNDAVRRVDLGRCLTYHFQGNRHRSDGERQSSLERMLLRPLEICRDHRLTITGDVYVIKTFCSLAHPENRVSESVIVPIAP